jgi:hypothetical protein
MSSKEQDPYIAQRNLWIGILVISIVFLSYTSAAIYYFNHIKTAINDGHFTETEYISFSDANSMVWISAILLVVALAVFIASSVFVGMASTPALRDKLPLKTEGCLTVNPEFTAAAKEFQTILTKPSATPPSTTSSSPPRTSRPSQLPS